MTNSLFETMAEITRPEPQLLAHFEYKAKRAYNNISFSPEKRGEQMIKDYSEELSNDLNELKSKEVSEEQINDYKGRYERFFSSYLHAKSNTFSAMITGPAKFPTRRHEKANRSEQRHYEIFREWRIRAMKAIVRKSKPATTFNSEIERYKAELLGMQNNHDLMKEGNKRIAKAAKTGEDLTQYLTDTFGIKPHMIEWTIKFGFGLQNNNANMKRVEQRIKELEQKETLRQEQGANEFTFEGGKVLVNYEADRIQIFFDSRPTTQELNEWKQKGLNSFNWSPSNNCWQRKITANATSATRQMFKGLLTKV